LDWAEDDDGGAEAAAVRRGVEEFPDSRFRRKALSDLGATDSDPLAVNDSNLSKSEALRLFEVVGQRTGDILRPKGMKVERIFYGYAPHSNPKSKIENPKSPLFTELDSQIPLPLGADGIRFARDR
jgi:hypothetical protein